MTELAKIKTVQVQTKKDSITQNSRDCCMTDLCFTFWPGLAEVWSSRSKCVLYLLCRSRALQCCILSLSSQRLSHHHLMIISPPSRDHLATISRSSHHHLVIFTLYISIIIILYFNTVPYIFKEIINNCGSMVHMYIYCTFILRTLSFLNDVFQNCIICTNTVLCTSLKCKIIKSSCFNSSANMAS